MKNGHEEIKQTEMKQNETNRGRAFKVRIRETLERVVTVYEGEMKEPTMDEAVRMVSDWWHTGQIVLECEDISGVEFEDAGEVESTEAEGGEPNGMV